MADQKLTQLAEITDLSLDDLLYVVNAPGSTPASKKAPIELLRDLLETAGANTPGGRLTLTSGTPVTTADVASSTSVYYVPFIHDRIPLWDGAKWQAVIFTEKTLALGTVTNALPYDVFGYLSSGSLALEKLAWASDTARATAITIQGGRYCKAGDKTRLYLGTFRTISTTQTADAAVQRFLWNMYNRRPRRLLKQDNTSHTYNAASFRIWNNTAGHAVELVLGLAEDVLSMGINAQITANALAAFGAISLGFDVTNAEAVQSCSVKNGNTGVIRAGNTIIIHPTAAGYHYVACIEFGNASSAPTFSDYTIIGFVFA